MESWVDALVTLLAQQNKSHQQTHASTREQCRESRDPERAREDPVVHIGNQVKITETLALPGALVCTKLAREEGAKLQAPKRPVAAPSLGETWALGVFSGRTLDPNTSDGTAKRHQHTARQGGDSLCPQRWSRWIQRLVCVGAGCQRSDEAIAADA